MHRVSKLNLGKKFENYIALRISPPQFFFRCVTFLVFKNCEQRYPLAV